MFWSITATTGDIKPSQKTPTPYPAKTTTGPSHNHKPPVQHHITNNPTTATPTNAPQFTAVLPLPAGTCADPGKLHVNPLDGSCFA